MLKERKNKNLGEEKGSKLMLNHQSDEERKELGKALTLSNRICLRGFVGVSNVEKPEEKRQEKCVP